MSSIKKEQSIDFYQRIEGFKDFSEIDNSKHYFPVPADWFVLISDIVGSTKAIDSGQYKDVNTLGAATISVLQNSLGNFHFPFVFGGDGATALVHQSDLPTAKRALLQLKAFARKNFKMDLRIGAIAVSEILSAQQRIEVAKFFMNPHKSIAMIRGGGVSWADDKIKQKPEKYCFEESDEVLQDLSGLSCRWQPLPSERGKIMTLLIKPIGDDEQTTLKNVVLALSQIFNGDFSRANPVQEKNMHYKGLLQCLKDEWKYSNGHFKGSYFNRILMTVISVLAFKWKLPSFFDKDSYQASILSHSDYKKYDDTLRMVMDCTHQECEAIEALLDRFYSAGKILYGHHYSEDSIMTCLVENLQQGGHIHFIDGGNGGYTMAAKILKKQIKQRLPSN